MQTTRKTGTGFIPQHALRPSGSGRSPLVCITLLLSLLVSIAPASFAAASLDVGRHGFVFLGVTYLDDGTSTWAYRITSGTKPSLSHWVLELDASLNERIVVSSSERYEVGTDPRTGLCGLKFDEGYEDGETREVAFTLDRWYVETPTRIGIKAGKNVDIGGEIPGPGPEILASNCPPQAADDSAVVEEQTAIDLDVLANDADPDGAIDPTTVVITRNPKNGKALVGRASGFITYTSEPGLCGEDCFQYTVEDVDGAVSNEAKVRIAVVCNLPPHAEDDHASTDENASVNIQVLKNDEDPDGVINSATVVIIRDPSHGTVDVSPVTGCVAYTPDRGTCGEDTFLYTVEDDDGAVSNEANVSVMVLCNEPPLAFDDSYATREGDTLAVAAPGILANDEDAEGSLLSAVLVSDVAHGRLDLNANGSFEYVHDGSETTSDAFAYRANDGDKDSEIATVNIVITPSNDGPTAVDDSSETDEDIPVEIHVLSNDHDPDGDILSIDWVGRPSNGSVSVGGTTVIYTPDPDFHGQDAFEYTLSDGNGETAGASVSVTIHPVNDPPLAQDDSSSTQEDVAVTVDVMSNDRDPDGDVLSIATTTQPKNGSVAVAGERLRYTPADGFHGTDSFSYTVSDGRGLSAPATVTIAVATVNDPPLVRDDKGTTREDAPLTIHVLTNDSDPDGDGLSIESITSPRHGTAVPGDASIVYTPAPGFSGTDSFSYTATDGNGGAGTGEVIVTVIEVNDPPEALDNKASTPEGVRARIPVLANDSDPDSDLLRVESVGRPKHGTAVNAETEVEYIPGPGFSGSDTFSYTVSDGRGGTDTAQVLIEVAHVNDPPAAQNDSASTAEGRLVTVEVLSNDSDPDGDYLLIDSVSEPENGSVLNTQTTLSYIPDAGFSGVDRFEYTVSDGNGGIAAATVVVSVSEINNPPIAQDDAGVTDEGVPVIVPVLANDSDPDEDRLIIESVDRPANGRVSRGISDVTYTPDLGFSGIDSFAYTVSDGRGETATATVVVAVAPVNNAPIPQDDSATTQESTPVIIAVLENDSDPDGQPLTVTAVSRPKSGIVRIDPAGISYTPHNGFVGTDTFSYTVSDSRGLSSEATVTIGVTSSAGGAGGGTEDRLCDGSVVISEIAWAGTAADPRDEWIELRNLGATPVDLDGWILRWRRTRPTTPEEQQWKIVELSGTLAPAATPACDEKLQDDVRIPRLSRESQDGVAWIVQSEIEDSPAGYYTLQRRRNSTVKDLPADLLYDTAKSLTLELSDQGEIIMLMNPEGEIVDTANASFVGRDGWAGGNAATFATMERIDPLQPDAGDNWNTNMGVVSFGIDASNRLLTATPGGANSPNLESFELISNLAPTQWKTGEPIRVRFPLSRQERRQTGWPWIRAIGPQNLSIGAGGSSSLAGYTFSGHHEGKDDYILDIGTTDLPPGEHAFWIVYGPGQALFVPVLLTP